MRTPRPIYTDTQEHLRVADGLWFKWNFFVLLGAIGVSFGTYLIQQILGFVGMGINTVLFLILVWFLNTWLTSPTLVTGSWLAGLPFLRPFGFTADYLKDVVPFILFWSCGIVLVNSVVPWFWWPFLSYLWVIAIVIAMGIWAWNFKPEGKIVKDLSWKFLVAAMVWALAGLPALSWIEPWFDPEVRATVEAEQLEQKRVSEIEKARHDAAVAQAALVIKPDLPTSVIVPRCNGEQNWVKVTIPAGWTFVPAWQKEIASFQVLPNDSAKWINNPAETSSGIGAVRFCTPELIYRDESMALTWRQL